MCELEEKYKKFKKAIEIQKYKFNFGKILDLKLNCSICGMGLTVNGVTSHSVVHKTVYNDKIEFLKKYFNGFEFSVLTNEKIKYNERTFNKYIVVNNSQEFDKVRNYVYNFEKYYKKCGICGKFFISKNSFCSKECGLISIGKAVSNYYKNPENLEKIKERNIKIGKKAAIYNKNRKIPVWNKGLTGEDYLKHYEKEDGTNSLYEGLKINHGFFSKSSIEVKLENIFNKLDLRFENSWFCKNRQFDFLISFEKFVLIVEADGDYWHKSKRIFSDKIDRDKKRKEDNEKNSIISSIKNSKKPFYILRIWEYDINNNLDIIEDYFKLLIETDNPLEIINELNNIYNEFA